MQSEVSLEIKDTINISILGYIGMEFDDVTGQSVESSEAKKQEQINVFRNLPTDKQVNIYISNYGGNFIHGKEMYDVIKTLPNKKVAYIDGMTASAATFPAMACDEIVMSSTALLLIHKSSGMVEGNVNELKAAISDQRKIDEVMEQMYFASVKKRNPSITINDIKNLMNANNGKGKWLSAEEAKRFGLVDFVTENKNEINLSEHSQRVAALHLPTYITKKEMSVLKQIDNLIKRFKAEGEEETPAPEQKVISVKTIDGTVLNISVAGETYAAGDVVTNEDGSVAAGEFSLENGGKIVTDENGVIVSVEEIATPEPEETELEALRTENANLKAQVELLSKANAQFEEESKKISARLDDFARLTSSVAKLPKVEASFHKTEISEEAKKNQQREDFMTKQLAKIAANKKEVLSKLNRY